MQAFLYFKEKLSFAKERSVILENAFSREFKSELEKLLLTEANGLRNWIIHRYNKISEEKAIESMKKLLSFIKKICERFEKWTR